MTLQVNGTPHTWEAHRPLADLIAALGLSPEGVAVAVGGVVIPRSAWATTHLQDGDRVELLRAVGGG